MTFSPLCQILLKDRTETKLMNGYVKLPEKYREYREDLPHDPNVQQYRLFWFYKIYAYDLQRLEEDSK